MSSCFAQALRFGIAGDSDRRKMLAENVNRALAGLQGKAFGHQKMVLESTLRLHSDGAARQQHGSATDCERPCELAGFRCPALPKPRRLQTLRLDRIATICVAVCRPMLLATAVPPRVHWDFASH